eukprot:552247-Pyramimonas_sp.AAC.1
MLITYCRCAGVMGAEAGEDTGFGSPLPDGPGEAAVYAEFNVMMQLLPGILQVSGNTTRVKFLSCYTLVIDRRVPNIHAAFQGATDVSHICPSFCQGVRHTDNTLFATVRHCSPLFATVRHCMHSRLRYPTQPYTAAQPFIQLFKEKGGMHPI